jgi:adenine-specific DNA-methyltransferase
MDKLKMHSPDFTLENIAKLAELFPNCVTEAKAEDGTLKRSIDFDQLRQELSDHVVDGPRERYQLNWPGKREALLSANAPIAKTLRPYREESVNFDTTKNLFIEGDNLDALKLLQETYLNRVKMIYIDPPYNTGKEFLYCDSFTISASEYAIESGQKDNDGGRFVANPESSGRFHSDWITMLYPRLRLARNLLREDGVIFISIDDRELPNLRKLCDEVFGEENMLGCIVWKNATDNNPSNIAIEHEYVLVYCRNRERIEPVWKSPISDAKDVLARKSNELLEQFDDQEQLQAAYTEWFRKHKSELWPLDGYKYIDKGGVYAGIRGVHNPGKEGYRYDVIHPTTGRSCVQPLMGYRFPKATMDELLSAKRILFGEDETKLIELKQYAREYQEKLPSVIELDGRSGAYDLRDLFPEYRTAFKNPKPVKFLLRFVPIVLSSASDIVIDFFSGSSTTAQAVLEANAKDGLGRRFVMIQAAEPCSENSEAAKHGVSSIAEIGKERIRRAGRKLKDASGLLGQNLDIGFRVLKVDTSNMKDVYYKPDALKKDDLFEHIENIKEDRTTEDLLFQVLLDWGVDLSLPIVQENIDGKTVFFVDGNALAACFDTGVSEQLVKKLATRKPLRAVFRDAGFGSDSVKINVEQIFKLMSPGTEVKTI